MLLGLSRPDAGTVAVLGMAPRTAIAHGLVAAVMQTGGLLKDLTVRETVELTASLFAAHPSGRRGARAGRHRGHRRPAGRQVLRRPAAAAAVRHGPAARPGAAGPRRADHRHGRRGPARLLERHPRGRRSAAAPSSSPRTTSRRPTRTPTGSSWSARAASSPTAPPRRSRPWPPGRTVRATLPGADRPPLARAARRRRRRAARRHRAHPREGLRRGRPLPAHRRPPPATSRSPRAASRTPSSP